MVDEVHSIVAIALTRLDSFPACAHGMLAKQDPSKIIVRRVVPSSAPTAHHPIGLHCIPLTQPARFDYTVRGSGVQCPSHSRQAPTRLKASSVKHLHLAMPLIHDNYIVHISSGGEELPESSINTRGEVVRCMIRSKPGEPFKVHLEDSGEHDKCIRVYVDGQYLAGVAAKAGVSACLASVRTSAHATRAFLFAPASSKPQAKDIDLAGSIEVRIVHAERTTKAPAPRIIKPSSRITEINQRRKHVVLSEEIKSAVKATQSFRPTQPWDEPVVSFQFACIPEDEVQSDYSEEVKFDELDSDEELLDISWTSTPSASSPGTSECPINLTDSPATSPSPCAEESSSPKHAPSPIDLDALSDTELPVASRRALIPGPSQRTTSQKRLNRYLESSEDEDVRPKRKVKPRIEVNLKPYTQIETTHSARAKCNKRDYVRYGASSKKRRVKSPVKDS